MDFESSFDPDPLWQFETKLKVQLNCVDKVFEAGQGRAGLGWAEQGRASELIINEAAVPASISGSPYGRAGPGRVSPGGRRREEDEGGGGEGVRAVTKASAHGGDPSHACVGHLGLCLFPSLPPPPHHTMGTSPRTLFASFREKGAL